MSRDEVSLHDIVNTARRIIAFTADIDEATFLGDERTQLAVQHLFTILGEAVKRLSPEFRALHPEVLWRRPTTMRDFLVHVYDQVDLETVWHTAIEDVPTFLAQIEPLLPAPPE